MSPFKVMLFDLRQNKDRPAHRIARLRSTEGLVLQFDEPGGILNLIQFDFQFDSFFISLHIRLSAYTQIDDQNHAGYFIRLSIYTSFHDLRPLSLPIGERTATLRTATNVTWPSGFSRMSDENPKSSQMMVSSDDCRLDMLSTSFHVFVIYT